MADGLEPALRSPPSTIEEVLQLMQAIAAALPEADGVARFNALYLRTTQAVFEAVKGKAFEDRGFMDRLDVLFASRYFSACGAWTRGDRDGTPESWQALFESRARSEVAPLQFALAGMNAHINFDLSQALVATCLERGVELSRDTPQHRDFLAINDVLADTEPRVKAWFTAGLVGRIDHAMGEADDQAALWSIRRARDAAWAAAEATWALRRLPLAAPVDAYLRALDGMTGLAGRALLRIGLAT